MPLRRSIVWGDPRVKPLFGEAEIDWTHPLASKLEACWLYNEGAGNVLLDMCSEYPATINLTSAVTRAASYYGRAVTVSATASTTAGATFGTLTTGAAWTWESSMRPTSTGDTLGAVLTNTAATTGIRIKHAAGTASHIGSDLVARDSSAMAMDEPRQLCVMQTATTVDFYTEGFQIGSFTGLSLGSLSLTTMLNDTSSNTFVGDIDYQRVWTRTLSVGEALWAWREPYAMFRPIVRRRNFFPSARKSLLLLGCG